MPRRTNHEGSIRRRDDGGWEASISFDGQRYYARGKTRAEALRALGDVKQEHSRGELVPPSRVTVGEHLAEWLEAAQGDLKPKTVREYEICVRVWLIPAFGRVRLQALAGPQIERQFARWKAAGRVKGGTLLNVFRVLHRALVFAVRWGRLGRNPCDGLQPPKAVRETPKLWSRDEAEHFLGSLDSGRWETAMLGLLLGSGCRIGEALALRWADIDREAGTMEVRRSVSRVACAWVETGPKTRAGVRTIVLPDFARSHLAAWRTAQLTARLAAGPDWLAGDRVLTLADGRTPSHHQCMDGLERRCSDAGVPRVRLHDLRHLHASLLLADGLPVPAVAARLGHASPAVTMTVYAHALKGQDAEAARAVEALLGRAAV